MQLGDFTRLAKDYAHRTGYSLTALHCLASHLRAERAGFLVADVGAGTGKLTQNLTEIGPRPDRRTLLLGIHFSVGRALGQGLERVTRLYVHEHSAQFVSDAAFGRAEADFPDFSVVANLRDPRGRYVSFLKALRTSPEPSAESFGPGTITLQNGPAFARVPPNKRGARGSRPLAARRSRYCSDPRCGPADIRFTTPGDPPRGW